MCLPQKLFRFLIILFCILQGYLTESGFVNLQRVQMIMLAVGEVEDSIFKKRKDDDVIFLLHYKRFFFFFFMTSVRLWHFSNRIWKNPVISSDFICIWKWVECFQLIYFFLDCRACFFWLLSQVTANWKLYVSSVNAWNFLNSCCEN